MLTINQTIKKARELRSSHPQLNSFYFGPVTDIGSEMALLYRLFAMDIMPGTLSRGLVSTKYILYFADRLNKDKSNEHEIFSDTQLIALDIFAQLYEFFSDNDIEIDPNATISFFRDVWDDEVAGCQIEINVPQFYSRDTCQVPNNDLADVLLLEDGDQILTESEFNILL